MDNKPFDPDVGGAADQLGLKVEAVFLNRFVARGNVVCLKRREGQMERPKSDSVTVRKSFGLFKIQSRK